VGVAEAVKSASLVTRDADFPDQGEGLFAVSDGLVVVPEQGVMPASVVEGVPLEYSVDGLTWRFQLRSWRSAL
jgi:hypothetical protein